jgi:hypothetical protein
MAVTREEALALDARPAGRFRERFVIAGPG